MTPNRTFIPDGVMLIDKPSGCTSFEVVKLIKRKVGKLKVGHTGTLDPMATGLLPICIGEATKLSGLLAAEDKRYRARLRLGVATDTLDRAGKPVDTADVPELDIQQINDCLAGFIGVIQQIPPMYSALRVQGRRMYQLARDGVEVERKPREVNIESITLLDNGPDWLEIDVICGTGTYIRSLVADIAGRLGTLGHLEELQRTESAGWTLEHSRGLNELSLETIQEAVIPVHQVLSRLPRLDVGDDVAHRLSMGQHLSPSELAELAGDLDPSTVWFCPPEKSPLVLAQVYPGDDDTGLHMKIVRVLHPRQKKC
jgi:tRNA pseudouridine55 synthase